jgi:hypothetical protein
VPSGTTFVFSRSKRSHGSDAAASGSSSSKDELELVEARVSLATSCCFWMERRSSRADVSAPGCDSRAVDWRSAA